MKLPLITRRNGVTWRIKLEGSFYPFVKWVEENPRKSSSGFPGTDIITDKQGSVRKPYRLKFYNIYRPLKKRSLPITSNLQISYPDHINFVKDLIYAEEGALARKHKIRRGCNVVSLAGGRPAQISLLLKQHTGYFDSYTNVAKDYDIIHNHIRSLEDSIAYTTLSVTFGEILSALKNTNRKYDIFDIDTCQILDIDRAMNISNAVHQASRDTILLGVTHTLRGSKSREEVYFRQIPSLIAALQYHFNIKEYAHNYYLNTTLMYRESFILERKT